MIEFKPIEPALFTYQEAAQYLRLAQDGQDDAGSRRAMDYLVAKGLLRPTLVGRRRRYAKIELDRFISAETDRYGEVEP